MPAHWCWPALAGLLGATSGIAHPASAQERIGEAAETYLLVLGEGLPRDAGSRDPAAGPVPWLSVATANVHSCLLPLDVRVDTAGAKVHVNILEIVRSSVCPDAIGPASGSVRLPGRPGRYPLNIRAGERTDRYTLRISRARVVAEPRSASFTRIEKSRFQRAPRNSAAFYCNIPWNDEKGPDTSLLWMCDTFVRQLRDSLGASEFRFDPRRGEIAYPVRNGMRRADVRYVQFRDAADFQRADALLQSFRRIIMKERAGAMFMELQSWRGELIRSRR